ncbi:hypothetical protein AMTRI_Chr13g118920 [Amborella trichopoda]
MVSYSNIDYSISFQTNPVIFDGPNPDHHTRNVLLDLVIRERTTIRSATVAHDLFRPVIKVSCSIIPASSTQELQTLDSTFPYFGDCLSDMDPNGLPPGSGWQVNVVVDINGEREIVEDEEVETGYLEFLRLIEASQEDYPAKSVSKSIGSSDGDAKVLPCYHRYHKSSIFKWFESRNSCSVYRHQLPTE